MADDPIVQILIEAAALGRDIRRKREQAQHDADLQAGDISAEMPPAAGQPGRDVGGDAQPAESAGAACP